jgi:hypothetical protein
MKGYECGLHMIVHVQSLHSYMYIIPMYCTDFIVITRHNFEDFGLVNVFMSADDQLIHKLLKLGLQNIRSPGSHEI